MVVLYVSLASNTYHIQRTRGPQFILFKCSVAVVKRTMSGCALYAAIDWDLISKTDLLNLAYLGRQ